jgi:2-C-methyl-D-erythritol 4-phosphate cytidylyltransferase
MSSTSLQVVAVIVAGGRGTRMGAPDKTFLSLAGRPIVAHSLDAFQASLSITSIVLVAGEHTVDRALELQESGQWPKLRVIVTGGAERQDSVRAGMATLPDGTTLVAIHDGARPFVTPELIDACVTIAIDQGAAIAAMPVADTLKQVEDRQIVKTIPRSDVWAAQTPQVFNFSKLTVAMQDPRVNDLPRTDEASLFEALGYPVLVVPSTSMNLKITTPEDLLLAEAFIGARSIGMDDKR